jgi:hypothetical protein
MSGEFVGDARLSLLEQGRDAAIVRAEKSFQITRDSGGDAVVAQATRDAAIAAAYAAHTAAVARLVLPPGAGRSK